MGENINFDIFFTDCWKYFIISYTKLFNDELVSNCLRYMSVVTRKGTFVIMKMTFFSTSNKPNLSDEFDTKMTAIVQL